MKENLLSKKNLFKSKIVSFVSDPFGFSILELVLVILILSVIITVSVLTIRPGEILAKGRDNKRLSDINTLERAILDYRAENRVYPDEVNMLRNSTTLPSETSSAVNNSSSGWINEDLSPFLPMLPTDPVNDNEYNYKYQNGGPTYELNVKLEYFLEKMANDGGDNPNMYEVGTNLTLF